LLHLRRPECHGQTLAYLARNRESRCDYFSALLGGQYSHAIAKGALLSVGAGPQSHLYQHEQIGPLTPSEVQLEAAHHALTTAERLLGPTTYARVDLVPLENGTPAVLELELLDPALFFETAPAAASRFAQVLRHLIP
jgi:hypothetical protein